MTPVGLLHTHYPPGYLPLDRHLQNAVAMLGAAITLHKTNPLGEIVRLAAAHNELTNALDHVRELQAIAAGRERPRPGLPQQDPFPALPKGKGA